MIVFVALPKVAGAVMQQEHTAVFTPEVRGSGRQILFAVYTHPDTSPWWGEYGYLDPVVVGVLEQIGALASVQRAAKGHITRGTLHLAINLQEGADRSAAEYDINRIVASLF